MLAIMFVVSARSLATSTPGSCAAIAAFLARTARDADAVFLVEAARLDFAVDVRAIVIENLDRAELFKEPVGLI